MNPRRHRLVQRRGWDRAAAHYERCWLRQLAPAHDLALATAAPQPGERALDVACGGGAVTLRIAAAVAPTGCVVATDLSPNMVAATAAQAVAAGLTNVDAVCCDAEALDVDGPFDVAMCSLGLMYVPEPGAALGELRRVLRPGGRVVTTVWGERRGCGWAGIFGIVDARVDSDVCPLFFALGAPGALSGALAGAGFVDVEQTRLRTHLDYPDADGAIGAAFLGGPVALAYARFSPEVRHAVHAEYLASIADFATPHGGYRIPGEFVVASARQP
jgi:SAM-dependent methyltransferase